MKTFSLDEAEKIVVPPEEIPGTPSASDGAHLDDIPLPEGEGDATVEDVPEGPLTPDGFLTVEAFAKGFTQAFVLTGHLTGLQALVAVEGNPATPDAAQAVYDICRETPALQFIIRPGSVWIQRAAAIGAFAVPLAVGVKGELAAKRRARIAAAKRATANNQVKPADGDRAAVDTLPTTASDDHSSHDVLPR